MGMCMDMDMVTIPAGAFWMGSSFTEYHEDANECPRRRVWLPEYRIQRRLVSNAQWEAFLSDTGRRWEDWNPNNPKDSAWQPDRPVRTVWWPEARDFTQWLAERTGQPYCLPTEAQWEKAGRGCAGQRHPWGDDVEDIRRDDYSEGYVRTDRASPFGVCDMLEGLAEWCWDYDDDWYWCMDCVYPAGPSFLVWGQRVMKGRHRHGDLVERSDGDGRMLNRMLRHSSGGGIGFRVAIDERRAAAVERLVVGEWRCSWWGPKPYEGPPFTLFRIETAPWWSGALGLTVGPASLALEDEDYPRLPTFDGRRVSNDWPSVRAALVAEDQCEIALLRSGAPAVSERAVEMLWDAIKEDVELLPIEVDGHAGYVLNVITVVDCLDLERSRFDMAAHDPTLVWKTRELAVDLSELEGHSLFRIPPFERTEIFGSRRFADRLKETGLVGLGASGLPTVDVAGARAGAGSAMSG